MSTQSESHEYLHYRLVCILSSSALCLSSLVLDQRAVALLSCYTNICLPLTRLAAELLTPLEEEIKGLQAFRQPTRVKYISSTSPKVYRKEGIIINDKILSAPPPFHENLEPSMISPRRSCLMLEKEKEEEEDCALSAWR